jgi:hypothetical protein
VDIPCKLLPTSASEIAGHVDGKWYVSLLLGRLMNTSRRTHPASEAALIPRLTVFRITLVVGWMIALGASSAVSEAQLTLAGEKQLPQAVQPINFRQPEPLDFDDHAGYVSIFDGTSLKGWDRDPNIWYVENSAIVGVSSKDHPVGNSYIAYRGFEGKDFDLKLEIKVEEGGGSGIQYRSKTGIPWRRPGRNLATNPDWLMTGPQADIWSPNNDLDSMFTGQFYSENTPLGIIAWRGQVVNSSPGGRPRLVGHIGNLLALGGYIRHNAWNEYLIMARGGTFIHIMNGQLMTLYVDDDPTSSNNQSGFLGIEMEHVPSKVSVRNIFLKKLPISASAAASPSHDSIAGNWKLRSQLGGSEMGDPQMCTFLVKEERLTGSCATENGIRDLTGEIHGKSITWQLGGRFGPMTFTGTIDSDTRISGTFALQQAAITGEFTFTARRME